MSVMVNQMEKTWSTKQIGPRPENQGLRSRNQGAKSARYRNSAVRITGANTNTEAAMFADAAPVCLCRRAKICQ